MKKIGVTGTRSGMTEPQKVFLTNLLLQYMVIFEELHHGDCIGVDVEVAHFFKLQGIKTVCHPPRKSELRAFHKSDEFREPEDYFKRNRNIVDETDLLLVFPYQMERQTHGGTWYTYDYAKKKNKPIILILPDGSIKEY